MKSLLASLALVLALPAAASVQDGMRHWRAGAYEAAVAAWTGPAANGDADALFNIGQAYRLGRGVARDRESAIGYYRRAAARGHVAATANLGIALFQDGRRTEALGPLREAADKGDARAAYVLGLATFSGEGAARNPPLGYAWMLRARDGGLAEASGQAARMATLLAPAERARGEAAAAALQAGQPIPVDVAAPSARPAPAQVARAPEPDEAEAEDRSVGRGADARVSRPAPAARSMEAPGKAAAPPPAPGWRVQLGAYANERTARSAWAALVAQDGALVDGLQPAYVPRGGLVRLQVEPFAGQGEARDLCRRLAAAGRPCFVTEGSGG